jgi:hypothetical protein
MSIHVVIRTKGELILEMFANQVRLFRFVRPQMTSTDIIANVPSMLDALADALERGLWQSLAARDIAIRYAEQRERFGYDLHSLLTELGLLRSTILEVASQTGTISVDEVERLVDLLHESTIDAASHLSMSVGSLPTRAQASAAVQ